MFSAFILSAGLFFLIFCLLKETRFRDTNDVPRNTETVDKRGLSDHEKRTSISIIIACKNEAHNLETLFASIQNIDYPKDRYEIIFVDDNSTDDTFDVLTNKSNGSWKVLRGQETVGGSTKIMISSMSNANDGGKKRAIQTGIEHSKYEWIALTDADCIVHKNWLQTINRHIQSDQQISMFIGFSPETFKSHFQYFKQLATAINYAATTYAGFPMSCTGRNLVFEKKSFYDVNGYEGLFDYPSGDDKLLLKRFLSFKKQISYIPHPPIYTKPVQNDSLKNQNIRRYSKLSMSSLGWRIGMCLTGILLILFPIEFIFKMSWLHLIETGVTIILVNIYMMTGCFLHKEKIRVSYFFYSLIFPYYLAYQMTYSIFRKWTWK